MKLASNFTADAVEYASQGNAILGIRDSGKSYTATAIAEKLLDAGIPFVAFDPIGVWRNLKIGSGKNLGCPVVVAGDNADLELTVESPEWDVWLEKLQGKNRDMLRVLIDAKSLTRAQLAFRAGKLT